MPFVVFQFFSAEGTEGYNIYGSGGGPQTAVLHLTALHE